MCQDKPFCVFSETGALKQVMLHRPGNELNRLTINNMSDLLFDDLIWLEQAQREHDEFADILRREGCEVNGPREAACADLGIAGTPDGFVIFRKGKAICNDTSENLKKRLIEEIKRL